MPTWQGTCVIIATICALLAFVISCIHIIRHIFHEPHAFKKVTLKILVMVPIFSLDALITLIDARSLHNFPFLLTLVREAFEAYVVLAFSQLVFVALDGPLNVANQFASHMQRPEHPFCLKCIPTPFRPGLPYVAAVLVGVFQFCVLMALIVIADVIFFIFLNVSIMDVASVTSAYSIFNGIKSCSVSIAMYCLTVFYFEIERNEDLSVLFQRVERAEAKFFCIKGVIGFTILQNFACNVLAKIHVFDHVRLAGPPNVGDGRATPDEVGIAIQNFLLCCEMLIFAILHVLVYPLEHVDRSIEKREVGAKAIYLDTMSICRKALSQRSLVRKLCANNEGLTEEECKILFDTFDHERIGAITRPQFDYLLSCIHRRSEIERLTNLADMHVSSSGNITYAEFIASMPMSYPSQQVTSAMRQPLSINRNGLGVSATASAQQD